MLEFRLSRTDHKVVEEYLADEARSITAIQVDAPNLKFQRHAIAAAKAKCIEVLVDPLTERLTDPNYSPQGLRYVDEFPIDLTRLNSMSAIAEFVERVLAAQNDVGTVLVPPHFYVDSEGALDLNLRLAALTLEAARSARFPVRPILTIAATYLSSTPEVPFGIAAQYRQVGVDAIDLRISPSGGEDEGPQKVSATLRAVDQFRSAGLSVTLGSQASVGQTALALGLANGYSTGIGVREHFLHRPSVPRVSSAGGKRAARGSHAGVLIAEASITLPFKLAERLFADEGIRTRLGCERGICAQHLDGPLRDSRRHYLHARDELVTANAEFPAQWRAHQEQSRLQRAIEFRHSIAKFVPDQPKAIKMRSIHALKAAVDAYMDRAESA